MGERLNKTELLNIDCMEYMAGLEDNAFDLAIVDPPYNIKRFRNGIGEGDRFKVKTHGTEWDRMEQQRTNS